MRCTGSGPALCLGIFPGPDQAADSENRQARDGSNGAHAVAALEGGAGDRFVASGAGRVVFDRLRCTLEAPPSRFATAGPLEDATEPMDG